MEQKTIPAAQLRAYIWEGIRKEFYADKIELYLPVSFGCLCLTWHPDGTLSDGGRTLAELKKRLGDLVPYQTAIRKILGKCPGECKLVGGQKLEITYPRDPVRAMNMLLRAVSLISMVDVLSEVGTWK